MRFAGVSALCLGGAIALTGLAFLAIGDAGQGVSRLLVGSSAAASGRPWRPSTD